MATISEAFAIALEHHRAGRLPDAEQIYRQILTTDPNEPDAIHLLGVVAYQMGKAEVAVELISRAIDLKRTDSAFHCNLGNAFQAQGKLDEAVASYRRALELDPNYADAHYNLGNALKARAELDEAIACYRRALKLKPDFAAAQVNLGNAFRAQGNLDEAVLCLRRASQLNPALVDAHISLGAVLQGQRKLDEAMACYCRGLELKPDHAATYNNLGNVFKDQGKLDEAVACYLRALELKPDYAAAHNNLGSTFKDQGKLDEAIACYDRALELKADFAEAHSNRLYTLHFCSDYDAKTIHAQHRRWNQQFAEPLAQFALPHVNERSVDRRLRIGYVSPDLRDHAVGRFLLPLLETHDHGRFEIYCYSSVRHPDAMTDRCRAQADAWRNVLGYSDEQLADSIRRDDIDILVDLTMHMAESRLLAFARKPAPVQVAYLAYAGTTGLSTMDYRLTDPYLDPPAQDKSIYSEESIRLPETYWCYRPPFETPAVNIVPASRAGYITFGCLNNFCKVTNQTLAVWASLLQAMPRARLLLHAHAGNHRDRVRDVFAQRDISPDRLTFADMLPLDEYFRQYHQIDVALDPFPYGGGTTTCDALWMGVPVVSLAGQTAVGRGGLSILSNVGFADWVAYDSQQYVRIATELADDVKRLSELRATLRDRMQGSPLMDAPRFARNVEAAYRTMWQRWCARRS